MSKTTIVFEYDASAYRGGGIPGVPLRDLTQADIESMPPHSVASIKASKLYKQPKPKPNKPKVAGDGVAKLEHQGEDR